MNELLMDQNRSEGRCEVLFHFHEGFVVVIDAVDGSSLGGRVSISGHATSMRERGSFGYQDRGDL